MERRALGEIVGETVQANFVGMPAGIPGLVIELRPRFELVAITDVAIAESGALATSTTPDMASVRCEKCDQGFHSSHGLRIHMARMHGSRRR